MVLHHSFVILYAAVFSFFIRYIRDAGDRSDDGRKRMNVFFSHGRRLSFPPVGAQFPSLNIPGIPLRQINPPKQDQDTMSAPVKRLTSLASQLVSSISPSNGVADKKLPVFDELPKFENLTGCAWGVWGPEDQLGTVNLLTDEVVKRAAEEEILYV